MRHRTAALPLAALLVAGAALVGCTSARDGLPVRVGLDDPGTVTDEQIRASGARTVWQALRFTTTLHVQDDANGNPGMLYHRGRNTFDADQTPLLVMDGAIVSDFRHLHEIPAADLLRIRVRSPSSASAEYGALARAGVVEMDTRRR